MEGKSILLIPLLGFTLGSKFLQGIFYLEDLQYVCKWRVNKVRYISTIKNKKAHIRFFFLFFWCNISFFMVSLLLLLPSPLGETCVTDYLLKRWLMFMIPV